MPDDLLVLVADLQRRVAELEADRQRTFLDLRGSNLRRVRLGLQDDGTWGIRVTNSAGTLIVNTTGS